MPTLMLFNSKITFDENSLVIIKNVTCFTYHSCQLIYIIEYSNKEKKGSKHIQNKCMLMEFAEFFTSIKKKTPNLFTSFYTLISFQNSGFNKSQKKTYMETNNFLFKSLRREYL